MVLDVVTQRSHNQGKGLPNEAAMTHPFQILSGRSFIAPTVPIKSLSEFSLVRFTFVINLFKDAEESNHSPLSSFSELTLTLITLGGWRLITHTYFNLQLRPKKKNTGVNVHSTAKN